MTTALNRALITLASFASAGAVMAGGQTLTLDDLPPSKHELREAKKSTVECVPAYACEGGTVDLDVTGRKYSINPHVSYSSSGHHYSHSFYDNGSGASIESRYTIGRGGSISGSSTVYLPGFGATVYDYSSTVYSD